MSKNQSYNIHDLVHIYISSDVRPEIVKELDFQIGGFKNNNNEIAIESRSPRIDVFPFSHATQFINKEHSAATFYNSSGSVGKFLLTQKDSLFVMRTDYGFLICADYANFLINLYIQILVVEQGYSMIHAAAYINGKGSVNVLTGAGGIGKTAVLGYAVGEKGLQHLGDDIVLLGNQGTCKSFPREFVLKTYHRELYSETFKAKSLPKWNAYVLKRFLVDNAPFVGLTKNILKKLGIYYVVAGMLRPEPHLATIPPDELFGLGTIALSGKIDLIAYMDRSSATEFSINNIAAEVAVNRITSVIHYEWKDFASHFLALGALDVFNFPKYLNEVQNIIKNAISGARILQINIPNDASPRELIAYLEKNNLF